MKGKTNSMRFLSLFMAMALVLTLFAGAFSTAKAEQTQETPAASPSLIDAAAKGSITVTKYVTSNTAASSTHPAQASPTGNATGTTADAEAVAIMTPAYSTLEGAKFVLAQIYSAEQVMKYYDGTANNNLEMSNPGSMTVVMDDDTGEATSASYNNANALAVYTGVTGANGTFRFTSLPVGIYILMEVDSPANVVAAGRCEATVISLPMVNTATSSNNDNASWMYHINVYPKNVTLESSVTLEKVDTNGAALENVTFELWKADFEANGTLGEYTKHDVYTDPADNHSPSSTAYNADKKVYVTGGDGKLTIGALEAGPYGSQYKLVEVYTADISPNGYVVDMDPICFIVDKNRQIQWVADNSNSGLRLCGEYGTENNPYKIEDNKVDLTFKLRNELPTLDKQVKKNDHNTDAGEQWRDDEAYAIGEEITYKVTAYIPRNAAGMDNLVIKDTPSAGITDDTANLKVTYNNNGTDVEVEASKYTVATVGGGFTLTFTGDNMTEIAGKNIEVTYNAKLNKNAVIAGIGNENTVTLDYDQIIGSDDDVAEPSTAKRYVIEDSARVFTYSLQLTKLLDSAAGPKAEGVEFQLLDKNKAVIPVVQVGTGSTYRIAAADDTTTITTMQTDADGILTIQGVENTLYTGSETAEYYLKETRTVTGYNLLSAPFKVEIAITETSTWNTTGTADDKKQTMKAYTKTEFSDNAVDKETIINRKGSVLPQTGSMGYLLFCTVGLVLMGGGAMLIFGGRKKKIR